jgi:hypothetical protein
VIRSRSQCRCTRADRRFRIQDQAGELVMAALVISRLVLGQAGAARTVAMLDVDRPATGGTVGNLTSAIWARPRQRRVVVPVAGQLSSRVLRGGEQQLGAGLPGDPVDHPGQVFIALDAAGGGNDVPPVSASPGGCCQLDQLLIRQPGFPAEIGGKLS